MHTISNELQKKKIESDRNIDLIIPSPNQIFERSDGLEFWKFGLEGVTTLGHNFGRRMGLEARILKIRFKEVTELLSQSPLLDWILEEERRKEGWRAQILKIQPNQ